MNTRLLFITLVLIAIAFFAADARVVSAQKPDIDNEVLRIAKGLYCPVCPATPLDVCETQACKQWRDLIRQKLLAGETEEQIRAYFIAQYGERVLGAPPPVGFNLGAYILPLLLLLAGGGVVYFTIRGSVRAQRRAPAATGIAATGVSGEYAERIARELEE